MPLRPIDAIFVHPERRLYVVYYRGELWQLPRMKIDDASWQRRRPYIGDAGALYLSSHQTIQDPILAQKLRTLHLPTAVRGSTLSRFEAWWEMHGFKWITAILNTGQSPLAGQQANFHSSTNSGAHIASSSVLSPTKAVVKNNINTQNNTTKPKKMTSSTNTNLESDIFATMLAELTDEVRNYRS